MNLNEKILNETIEELNEMIEKITERMEKGEIKITVVKERIITPDQKKPHQFTGLYSWEM